MERSLERPCLGDSFFIAVFWFAKYWTRGFLVDAEK